MSSFAALREIRIGCVAYLNAQPLIHAYPGEVILDHPSRLAEMLLQGEVDAALVPIFTAFHAPGFEVVDGVSISSFGPVFSVFLAYRGSLAEVKSIVLDPASRTSCHLLKCVLAEFHDLHPRYAASCEADARLLIGDQAIAFRQKHGADFQFLDLGEEWRRCTGLPFVFAVWLMKPGLRDAAKIAEGLRALKEVGVACLDQVAEEQRGFAPEFARKYFRDNVRFDLGASEKEAIALFRELLAKHGFLAPGEGDLKFV